MQTHNEINNSIQSLMVDADSEQLDCLHNLGRQFSAAGNAYWSREDLATELKSDNDVLDTGVFDEGGYEWAEIREIQDAIINFFGE